MKKVAKPKRTTIPRPTKARSPKGEPASPDPNQTAKSIIDRIAAKTERKS